VANDRISKSSIYFLIDLYMKRACSSCGSLLIQCCVFLCCVSCSVKIPHADGTSTYLGMVRVNESSLADSPVVHTRRYGAAVDMGTERTGVTAGYQETFKVLPPNDSFMTFDYQTKRSQYSGSAQRSFSEATE